VRPDEFGIYRIATDRAWQGGPAAFSLEVDAHVDDKPILIVHAETESRSCRSDMAEFETNVGVIELSFGGPVKIRHSLALKLRAARNMRDALVDLVAVMERIAVHGWEEDRA
jgi:hypothetical protein